MVEDSHKYKNDLQLTELFAVIWHHKLLIFLCIISCLFFASYTALTTEKRYIAEAIFKIERKTDNGLNLPNNISGLLSFSGLRQNNSDRELLIERLSSREFILSLNADLNFQNDSFFNDYNPNNSEPLWKATVKEIIGWETKIIDANLVITQKIIKNFLRYVSIGTTPAGAISISVTHRDENKAALYANQIMNGVKRLIEVEEELNSEVRLAYLSEILANALEDMEVSQKKLQEYSLQNSLTAQESFLTGSFLLEELRTKLKDTKEVFSLLKVLEELIANDRVENDTYANLRVSYPLIDDVRFRRILGMSETISAWSWPDYQTLQAVKSTLSDRIQRLEIDIAEKITEAKNYASNAKAVGSLKRNATIAEAAYTVLIEQVKSQSLIAGFRPESFKVFQYATIPIGPSTPNRRLLLVVGFLSGIFLGSGLALLNWLRNGVLYTISSIEAEGDSRLNLRSTNFRRLSNQSLPKIKEKLKNYQLPQLDEAMFHLSEKKLIYVFNAGSRISSTGLAKIIATYLTQTGRNILLIDIPASTKALRKKNETENLYDIGDIENIDGINVVKTENKIFYSNLLANKEFKSNLNKLIEKYDHIVMSTDKSNSLVGLSAIKDLQVNLVTLCRRRKTKKKELKKIKSAYPIGILFNE